MSLFGAYAFSEASFNSASLNVALVTDTNVATTAFNNAGISVLTGASFAVEEINAAQTSFNNDDITVIGSALFEIDTSDPGYEAVTAVGSLGSIFSLVFGMTPTLYVAYPKTITDDPSIVGETNDSKVFDIVSNHLLYVINEKPGVYDGGIPDKTYKGQPIDPSFIAWIVYPDTTDPYPVCVGNLSAEDRVPVGLKPRGAPNASDITALETYFNGTATGTVYDRARQLLWGVPKSFIENERFYDVVTNNESQTYESETPSPGNNWNNLVI